MTDREKELLLHYLSYKDALKNISDQGVVLYLDGEESSPEDIASARAFRESSDYLEDREELRADFSTYKKIW